MDNAYNETQNRHHHRDQRDSRCEQVVVVTIVDEIVLLQHIITKCKNHSEENTLVMIKSLDSRGRSEKWAALTYRSIFQRNHHSVMETSLLTNANFQGRNRNTFSKNTSEVYSSDTMLNRVINLRMT